MSTQEFNSLIINSTESLKPFAITLTHDPEEAKDLCQETLYKAFAYRDKYRPGTNIKAWLFTIMRNIFINNYRRNGRKKIVMDTVRYFEGSSLGNAPDKGLMMREIESALYHLPAIFKTSCELYLQGYKYQEIAEALNEPLGTIKSRIHFARKLLQKRLQR